MKKTLLIVAGSLLALAAKAQTDSLARSGVSLQASAKMSEFLSNGLGAELMVIKYNHDHVLQPYMSFSAGFGNNSKDELWEYSSYAFSAKAGVLCRLTDAGKDEFRLYLRPGIGYIRRTERLKIIVENEHWGASSEVLSESNGSIFLDMGMRMEAKISRTLLIVAEPSFYVITSHVPKAPFDDRIDYRQEFDGNPNPGLGAGNVVGVNLSVGIGILIR